MEYETPELTALPPAIGAIQAPKSIEGGDSPFANDAVSAYEDWE